MMRIRIGAKCARVYAEAQVLKFFRRRTCAVHAIEHGSPNGCAALSPDVRACFNDDGVVFLHLHRGIVFRSNPIGAAVWKGLTAGEDMAAVAAQIGRDYSVPPEQVAQDVTQFVAQLEREGLLVHHMGH